MAVKNIVAKYNGASIVIGETIPKSNFIVNAIHDDNSIVELRTLDYNIVPETILNIGSNIVTIEYALDSRIKTAVVIPGIKKAIRLQATYRGPALAIGESVSKNYIIAELVYSDESYSIVTNWTSQSMVVTESGVNTFTIYYNEFTATLQVTGYKANLIQLHAAYNGPELPAGSYVLDESLVTVRAKYDDNRTVTVTEGFTITGPEEIISGPNTFHLSYDSKVTSFTIYSTVQETELLYITAIYNGPDIEVEHSFSLNHVLCTAYYSNNTTGKIINFEVSSNIITQVGINSFTVYYNNKSCTFIVMGTPKDSTTQNNINKTKIIKDYPEAVTLNHRFRGPAESEKLNDQIKYAYENLHRLYDIFENLEVLFNEVAKESHSSDSYKIVSYNRLDKLKNSIKEERGIK